MSQTTTILEQTDSAKQVSDVVVVGESSTENNNINNNNKLMDVSNTMNQNKEILTNDVTDSENELKVKLKPLESETENRNTSTSNAGESEYESANEEELVFSVTSADDENISNQPDEIHSEGKPESLKETQTATDSSIDEFENDKSQNEIDDESDSKNINDIDVVKNDSGENSVEEWVQNDDDEDEDDLTEDIQDDLEENEEIDSDAEPVNEMNDSECEEPNKSDDRSINAADINNDEHILRESGDGEESIKVSNTSLSSTSTDFKQNQTTAAKAKSKVDLLKDKRNPQYIPRKASYFEHDDRGEDEDDQTKKPTDSMDTIEEKEENDSEKNAAKVKNKKKSLSMKLCSDEMDKDGEGGISKEKQNDTNSQPNSVESEDVNEVFETKTRAETAKKKSIWDSSEKWHHDKFNMDDQKPKSREELINTYGYDIRNENEAPRLNRRSKYGKGPQRYSRRSDDENAYAKKTLRKVIRNSNSSNSRSMKNNEMNDSGGLMDNVNANKPNEFLNHKRERVFEKRSVSRESDNERPKSISKDVGIGRSSYSSSSINNNNNVNNKLSYRNNNDTRIFENDRIFTNKSGQVSHNKYSSSPSTDISNNDRSFKQSSALNKSQPPPPSKDQPQQHPSEKEAAQRFSENNENNNNNTNNVSVKHSKDMNSNPLFTNDDFPALISTTKNPPSVKDSKIISHNSNISSTNEKHANSSSNNSNNNGVQANSNQSTSTESAKSASSNVIYYQNSSNSNNNNANNNSNYNGNDNEINPNKKRIINDTQQDVVVVGGGGKPETNTQPTTTATQPIIESLQFENSRFSRNSTTGNNNSKVTAAAAPINSNVAGTAASSSSSSSYYTNNNHNHQNWNNLNSSNNSTGGNNRNAKTGYNKGKYVEPDVNQQIQPTTAENNSGDDQMTKRYSAIRQQQQQRILPSIVPNNNGQSTMMASQTQFAALNNEELHQPMGQVAPAAAVAAAIDSTQVAKNVEVAAYYADPANVNELASQPPTATTNMIANVAGAAGHHLTNSYAAINGSTGAVTAAAAAQAPSAYAVPAGTNTIMAYYDPNQAAGQAAGSAVVAAAAAGLQGQLGLTPAYFATDQSAAVAAQAAAAQNYYIATDLSVAYQAAFLQSNFPQSMAASHHAHQSHEANRYLITAPTGTTPESNRYLQTAPAQPNSTQILALAGNLTGPSSGYPPTISAAFPSGYPQFPPQTQSATSPLPPAGYPNVQLASSGAAGANNTAATSISSNVQAQQQTPSGYPKLYRGGITYYDIPSQQQAMQRIQQNVNNQTQQQAPSSAAVNRRTKLNPHGGGHQTAQQANINEVIKNEESNDNNTNTNVAAKKLDSTTKNEIPVNN